ncbi:hypothetical protein ASU80_20510 [Enterobacter hormaechei subsp. xiangfangensis]|uniref:hypothetical protein n=1 Tax=Enterobacter hormaechei TaxID=158836 RepID=UPI0007354EC1|nr:hypothetical protein [Enterobacter hormaechei]KTI13318.1 hypothetical protein ASV11_21275 [Enterobacter hormaechei subsp. xiangfangensis]KTJ63489.1 hypothetical protein ASU80_20510 [Enterobacter hormaechei subsp. xiangfangensis]MDR9968008.1 hypothetical protein [Enterobacter hormaechei subsp. xiangfangensis]
MLNADPRARYATMRHLQEIAAQYGCGIRYSGAYKGLFTLFKVDANGEQIGDDIWLREMQDGRIVDKVRAITLAEWQDFIAEKSKQL